MTRDRSGSVRSPDLLARPSALAALLLTAILVAGLVTDRPATLNLNTQHPRSTIVQPTSSVLRMGGQHADVPIAHLAELLTVVDRGRILPGLRRPALARIAARLAVLTAQLRATGEPGEVVDAATVRAATRTGCEVINRALVVPRGFVDHGEIQDRIQLEASFHRAVITRSAEWTIEPTSDSAPQFSRVISVVFLSACPPARD